MARYLLESKALFLHVPRTGGSWVERAIDLCQIKRVGWLEKQPLYLPRKHCLLSHYHRTEMAKVDYVFAFVRHPVAYYESVWKWLGRNRNFMQSHWRWHPHRAAGELYRPEFDDWVDAMLTNEPLWCTRLFEQYVGPPGGEFCNYIGRTETLARDFREVMEHLGHEENVKLHRPELEALGKVNNIDRKLSWSAPLLAKVLETERSVIERFCEPTKIVR